MSEGAAGHATSFGSILVCFAVKEEARPFQQRLAAASGGIPPGGQRSESPTSPKVRVLLTGMGPRNALESIRAALDAEPPPRLVLSCGFAGGLRRELTTGTVVFAADPEMALARTLEAAGAAAGTFHSSDRVVWRAEEKRALYAATRADAVEMESGVISKVCGDRNVPFAVVRVILDSAEQDLPLDFNQVMTPDQRLDLKKLAVALVISPGKVPALLRLQRQSRAAAGRLAEVLVRVLDRTKS
jgi:nucleoside phosphorylase